MRHDPGTGTPFSPYCQRWRAGHHSWRHVSEGGFDKRRFAVIPIPEAVARAFVVRSHYLASYPAARLAYGLVTDDETLAATGLEVAGRALVGVAVLSVPMTERVLTSVFPDLEPYRASLELGRFVLTDPTPANAESWMLCRVWKLAAAAGVRGVVSFADPLPRRRVTMEVDDAGRLVERVELVSPGHVGIAYQATGAIACGRSTARTLTYLPRHGLVLPARTLSKVRQQESGAEAAERRLVAYGARPRGVGQRPAEWLREALAGLGAVRIRHPGNFRYAWALDRSRGVRLGVSRTGYPKPATDRLQAPAHWSFTAR